LHVDLYTRQSLSPQFGECPLGQSPHIEPWVEMIDVDWISKDFEMDNSKRETIVALLTKAYNAELETIINYLACSVSLDGIRAKHIKDSLGADLAEELGHAQQLAARIKILDGKIPGSQALQWTQTSLQPPASNLDVVSVIKGVIDAEQGAIELYQQIINAAEEGEDPVTADLCTTIKGDEEEHRREFKGYLAEAESMSV